MKMRIRKLLKPLVNLLRQLVPVGLILRLELFAARSGFLVGPVSLLRGGFAREQRAVLYGRAKHQQQLLEAACDDGASHTLRRYTHILEKGLIMQPRRSVFAKNLITETVDLYESLASNPDGANGGSVNPLLPWATDVLDEYFEVNGDDPIVNAQRERFRAIVEQRRLTPGARRPYKRDTTPLNTTYDDLLKLAERRRSCRWYLQTPVPREIIDRAIAVAAQSPNACNRQPFEFRIFDTPEDARRIGSIPLGTRGFADQFPCLAVVVGQLHAFPFARDRHLPYIDGALAAMAFQFALEVQGIGSCCINFPEVPKPEEAMAKALDLRPDERPIMCISFGYPDPRGEVPYSQNKSLEELRRYD